MKKGMMISGMSKKEVERTVNEIDRIFALRERQVNWLNRWWKWTRKEKVMFD